MKFKNILAAIVAGAAMLVSCSEALEIETPSGIDAPQTYVTIPNTALSASVSMTTTDSWTTQSSASWLSVSPASGGAGSSTLTFNATESKETRTAYVTVTVGNSSQRFTVTQIGNVVKGTADSPYTVAEAVALIKGGTQPKSDVYVKGIVCNIIEISIEYKNATFEISDDGKAEGDILQIYRTKYLDGADFTATDQIQMYNIVVVKGTLIDYQGTPETKQGASLYSIEEGTPLDDGTITLTEALALADKSEFSTKNALVTAVTSRGFVAADAESAVYVYTKTVPSVSVGNVIKFSGVKTTYNGLPEITGPADIVVSGSDKVVYPEAKDITAEFDTYTNSVPEYISFTGDLLVSGGYYNVTVAGAENSGSLTNPVDQLGLLSSLNGKNVTVTGYFNGVKDGRLSIIATGVKDNGGSEVDTSVKSFIELWNDRIMSTDNKNPDVVTLDVQSAVVSYVSGSNAFIQDGTSGICLYAKNHGLNPGDVISGKFDASFVMYNGIVEMVALPSDWTVTEGGDAPEAQVVTIAELKADYNKYVSTLCRVNDITLAGSADGESKVNVAIEGVEDMTLRTQDKTIVLEKGAKGDAIVIPTYYKTDKQLGLWEQGHFMAK